MTGPPTGTAYVVPGDGSCAICRRKGSRRVAAAGDLLGDPLQHVAGVASEYPVRRNLAQPADHRHQLRRLAALVTIRRLVLGPAFRVIGHDDSLRGDERQ
jgi:hypothetical protein